MTTPGSVSRHYGTGGLEKRILEALAAAGADVDALTVDDLAPVDAFHIRGRGATAELAEWAELDAGLRVLDVGSGLGGTARFLASGAGCSVDGVDLTAEYCQVAAELSRRVGLESRTRFHHGSALALPFPDGSFERAWTEHAQMNIADKATFYSEIARVLAPGGLFAFHDIFASEAAGELEFPVPWAHDPSISHLIGVEDLGALLTQLGFSARRWEDVTGASVEFLRGRRQAAAAASQAPPLGLHLLAGPDTKQKFANLLAGLEDGKLRVIEAVMAVAQ